MFGQKYTGAKLNLHTLYQGERWVDGRGTVHKIQEMEEGHIRNVLAVLWRRRVELEFKDSYRLIWLVPPDTYFDWEGDMFERSPEEWYQNLPLVQAMEERLDEIEAERESARAQEALAGVLFADYNPREW